MADEHRHPWIDSLSVESSRRSPHQGRGEGNKRPDIYQNCQPERHAKQNLAGFVPEHLLRYDGARPASEQTQHQERAFGGAPLVFLGRGLVVHLEPTAHQAHGNISRSKKHRGAPR